MMQTGKKWNNYSVPAGVMVIQGLLEESKSNGYIGSKRKVVLAKAKPLLYYLGFEFPRRPVVTSRLPGPPLRGQNENTRGTSRQFLKNNALENTTKGMWREITIYISRMMEDLTEQGEYLIMQIQDKLQQERVYKDSETRSRNQNIRIRFLSYQCVRKCQNIRVRFLSYQCVKRNRRGNLQ